ncbi:MAG: dTMP kinase [Bacilli bacterium]|nr:dTMP kinase [Bacilli bacterium]
MKKGKFIVIDGTDGSGKGTQTNLLVERLLKENKKVKKMDFPQYKNNFFGRLLRDCLDGKLGDFIAVNPKIASVLYAADRWESASNIRKWLDEGYTIISDRYVSSNQIHQGGKIKNDKDRVEFMKWLDEMEFKIFKIPKPDGIIFLDVPIKITEKLIKGRAKDIAKKTSKKVYRDLADKNKNYLENSRISALKIVKNNNAWYGINCVKGNSMMSIEEVHGKVYDLFNKIIKK